MSTKMSNDLNITRPTSRVSRPPGGATTFSFGDPEPTKQPVANSPVKAPPAPVANTPAKPPAPPAEVAKVETHEEKPVKNTLTGKVCILIGGEIEPDFVAEVVAKALIIEGVKGAVVSKVNDIAALPYAAQNLRNFDVIIATTILPIDNGTSQVLSNTLLQIGVSGRTPIIPGIVAQSSLLEAKALLPTLAQGWAKSVYTILDLQNGGVVEPVPAPEIVIPEKPVLTPTVSDVETLMGCLRESLKERGARGIIGLSRKFRIIDDDNSGSLDIKEFSKAINEHKLGWNENQIKLVFEHFDKDKSKSISFDEFIQTIRGELNERRKQLVLTAFGILDADHSGIVELNDIMAKYDASKHPDVISGKRTKESVLSEFLDTFDTEEKDGKVTPSEFIKYYANVSSSIDEDDYFELMIRNAWHISGGEGWCANSSCRRVLVVHKDGRQTVEEIKNDLGIKADDKEAMIANLVAQGIKDIESIELSSGDKASAKETAKAVETPAAAPAPVARPGTASTSYNPRRQPGGATSIVLG